jgi:acetoin utilization protein AcuB
MIVGNWMKHHPLTVTAETLVSEAKRILDDNNVQSLPVVDQSGRLRGLVTQSNLLRLSHFVLRTQNQDEFAYFNNRLRVRDVMVRNPGTVRIDDTMELCLKKGRELGVSQFPVLDGERVVGTISASEIFELAAHAVGAWEKRNGVTLAPQRLGPGVLGRIADAAEGAGAQLHAIYPMPIHHAGDPPVDDGLRTVVLRFHSGDLGGVVRALEAGGFRVVAKSEPPRAGVAA